jgi:hypothetical protein
MNADRFINTHTRAVVSTTLPNGDTVWVSGPNRVRYSHEEKATYYETLYRGKWYIDDIEEDADITFTVGVGFTYPGTVQTTLVESPIQEIN